MTSYGVETQESRESFLDVTVEERPLAAGGGLLRHPDVEEGSLARRAYEQRCRVPYARRPGNAPATRRNQPSLPGDCIPRERWSGWSAPRRWLSDGGAVRAFAKDQLCGLARTAGWRSRGSGPDRGEERGVAPGEVR